MVSFARDGTDVWAERFPQSSQIAASTIDLSSMNEAVFQQGHGL